MKVEAQGQESRELQGASRPPAPRTSAATRHVSSRAKAEGAKDPGMPVERGWGVGGVWAPEAHEDEVHNQKDAGGRRKVEDHLTPTSNIGRAGRRGDRREDGGEDWGGTREQRGGWSSDVWGCTRWCRGREGQGALAAGVTWRRRKWRRRGCVEGRDQLGSRRVGQRGGREEGGRRGGREGGGRARWACGGEPQRCALIHSSKSGRLRLPLEGKGGGVGGILPPAKVLGRTLATPLKGFSSVQKERKKD